MSRKVFIYSFVIVLFVGVISIVGVYLNNKNKEYEVIDNIIDVVLNSNSSNVIYIAKNNTEDYNNQLSKIKLLVEDYDFNYYYININNIPNYKVKKIYKELQLGEEINDTILAIYDNGDLKTSIVGTTGLSRMYNLLKDNNLVEDKKLPINYLNTTNFLEKLSEDSILLGVGNYKNSYSNSFEEILWQISEEYNIEINFLYLCDLSESEGKLFESKLTNFKDFNIKIPSLILVKNGKIESAVIGLVGMEDYVEFLNDYDIIG